MAGVRRADLPSDSALARLIEPGDFSDCYSVPASADVETCTARATAFPGWVKALLVLRDRLVRPFGLRIMPSEGDRIGPFPVISRTQDEIVLGFDDRHLDFRLSMMRRGGMAMAATWVRPHNLGGRLYLAVVMPFHIVIMRGALARCARA